MLAAALNCTRGSSSTIFSVVIPPVRPIVGALAPVAGPIERALLSVKVMLRSGSAVGLARMVTTSGTEIWPAPKVSVPVVVPDGSVMAVVSPVAA